MTESQRDPYALLGAYFEIHKILLVPYYVLLGKVVCRTCISLLYLRTTVSTLGILL